MKKYNCPFCKIRLDNDLFTEVEEKEYLNKPLLWFCPKTSCSSKFNITFEGSKILEWSFRYNDFRIVNRIFEDYCFCTVKEARGPKNKTRRLFNVWDTVFECEAWDTDPFNKTALLEKLNYHLTFS